jgi:hypothetical protein
MITPQAFINYKNLVLNAKKGKTMITLEEFKKGKIAINTRTQEEYDNLMRFFDSKEIVWSSGNKSSTKDYSIMYGKETHILFINNKFTGTGILYSDKNYNTKRGYKIITPNELQEYNEFMEKSKTNIIFTAPQDGYFYIKNGKFTKEEDHLTIGQAIDYMLESEDNVVEYYDDETKQIYKACISHKRLQQYVGGVIYGVNYNYCFENWINIRKYIEPKQKTLKDLIENKEPFEYKNNWYRFNKDGAIIDSKGSAIGIEFIKELLTIKENK